MEDQFLLRNLAKQIKWQENISYKTVAEDLLGMEYRSYLNWIHGRCNLGQDKVEKLKDFIYCLLD